MRSARIIWKRSNREYAISGSEKETYKPAAVIFQGSVSVPAAAVFQENVSLLAAAVFQGNASLWAVIAFMENVL